MSPLSHAYRHVVANSVQGRYNACPANSFRQVQRPLRGQAGVGRRHLLQGLHAGNGACVAHDKHSDGQLLLGGLEALARDHKAVRNLIQRPLRGLLSDLMCDWQWRHNDPMRDCYVHQDARCVPDCPRILCPPAMTKQRSARIASDLLGSFPLQLGLASAPSMRMVFDRSYSATSSSIKHTGRVTTCFSGAVPPAHRSHLPN